MTIVQQILQSKGPDIWSISPDSSVYQAIELMADKGIGALLVVEDGKLIGIISERDYARKVILQGKSSRNTPISEIMTRKVYYVRPEHAIEECMALMTDKRIRHLPVLEDDRLVGIISIGDVIKAIISDQQFMIEQLENYITGR
jgi:CBS domain-containing protein